MARTFPEFEETFLSALPDILRRIRHVPDRKALERDPIYLEHRQRLVEMAETVVHQDALRTPPRVKGGLRFVHWNIERGKRLDEIKNGLRDHAYLREADVVVLTETDIGMARSGNRHVAQEVAEMLGFEFLYVNSYLCLTKGTREELEVEGDNRCGLHGVTLLSRYPIEKHLVVTLPAYLDKMRGHEKRLGFKRALLAQIQDPNGGPPLVVAGAHLDAHSSPKQRAAQLRSVLDAVDQFAPAGTPTIIGGDLNTTTYSTFNWTGRLPSILMHLARGVRRSIEVDYLYPDRFYEPMFAEMKARGYDVEPFNEMGVGTVLYDHNDPDNEAKVLEHVPRFVFDFLGWMLKSFDGKASMKVDWFLGKNLEPAKTLSGSDAFPTAPRVVREFAIVGSNRLSDHRPIGVDLRWPLAKPEEPTKSEVTNNLREK